MGNLAKSAVTCLGVDTGGTFTDFVLWRDGQLIVHKVLSTPEAPERAILQGVHDLQVSLDGLVLIHGSTVATNAVLEGKGVVTAFVTNRGFADLLTIGRQDRAELYNLLPAPVTPPVPHGLCFEVGGRLAADGSVVEPLPNDQLAELVRLIEGAQADAVAICLLFSYLDDRFERQIADALPVGTFVSLSSQVLPEIGEYERGIATWLNAWVGPLVRGYLERLAAALDGGVVSVMQSSGETMASDLAAQQAVRMLLSGPAGGLVGAQFVGAAGGQERLLTLDMGGTSTDVALIQGAPQLTNEGHIGRFPVAVPMVDMHTIGAGGGSIAWLDDGGMLQVGPASAGASPGPACYGGGGLQPTVTDANLVLGRLRADDFLGGDMPLDVAAARRALRPIAEALRIGIEDAAAGVVAVANAHMARALRTISIERGVDPRGFTLAAFGGAGGLHVCALADDLRLTRAMIPVQAGVLSALGMLAARPGRQLVRTRLGLLSDFADARVADELHDLAQQGLASLAREAVSAASCAVSRSLDLRYVGQSYTINIVWSNLQQVERAFHEAHAERYGHALELPVELVNLRVAVKGPAAALDLGKASDVGLPRHVPRHCEVADCGGSVALVRRSHLAIGQHLVGPAVITERVATTWLAPHWEAVIDAVGNLQLRRVAMRQ
jgi:N-methylhydantoinase A